MGVKKKVMVKKMEGRKKREEDGLQRREEMESNSYEVNPEEIKFGGGEHEEEMESDSYEDEHEEFDFGEQEYEESV